MNSINEGLMQTSFGNVSGTVASAFENTQVLARYEGESNSLDKSYIYGNERISEKTSKKSSEEFSESASSLLDYIYDARGSVTENYNNNKLTRSLSYDPYGEIVAGNTSYESFYGYNSEEYDPNTGLSYLRARYLDLSQGGFIQEDNYLGNILNSIGLNAYSYAFNNPVMYQDPSGHWPKASTIGKVVGGVVGAAIGIAVTAAIIASSAITIPVACAVAVGVATATATLSAGAIIGSEIEQYQTKKEEKAVDSEIDELKSQIEDINRSIDNGSISENDGSSQIASIEAKKGVLEQKKKNLCDRSKELQKQEKFYNNVCLASLGVISIGLTPVAAPAIAGSYGDVIVSFAGTAIASSGAMGVINHTSNIIESETGVNPVKDYIYQGNEDAYNEDTALIDSVNMFSTLTGISALSAQSNRFAQSVTQNKQKAKAVEAEAENVTEYNSRIIEAQEENFRPGRESVTAVQEASQSASTAVEKSNLNYGSISSHNEYKISKVSDPKVKLAVGADGNLEGAKTPVVRGGATGSGESAAYKGGSGKKTLYHYTNEKGLKGITESNQLNPSLKANNPKDARYGNGQYLSDINPESTTPAKLARKFINVPNRYKYTHYIEIDVTDLNVIQGRDGVYVIPNEEALDLTGRIKNSGKVGD